jgi:predicted nucleic acid-binding protein
MKNTDKLNESKNLIYLQLNSWIPDFNIKWNKIVKKFGNDYIETIIEIFKKDFNFFKELFNFKFIFVIDNNVIFGQIKNILEKNKKLEDSFIYKLVNTPFIEVYAPCKLKEELNNKIDEILNTNKELAHKYADELLKNIIIKDAEWTDDWKKAKNSIGQIDIDDVSYLALALCIESHGIISFDKVFQKQGFSKVFKIQDVDNIVTCYNSGIISFLFLGSIGIILELLCDVILIIFNIICDILIELINVIFLIANNMINLLSQIPNEIILILMSIGLIEFIFSPEFRKNSENIIININDFIKNIINKIKIFIDNMILKLNDFGEIFKPIGISYFEIVIYLVTEFNIMKETILEIEKAKAK